MARAPALALLAMLLLAACTQPGPEPSPTSQAPPPEPPVRFVAYGDAGTGEPDQARVAAALARVCAQRGCDFALALGDNLYDAGASSAEDPQFESKFETPYAALAMPFWLVLGNHDNANPGGSPAAGLGAWYETGNHQVEYSRRSDRVSDKWHMPARYYNLTAGHGNTSVDFLALDTNTLVYQDLPVPPDLEARVREQTEWVDGAVEASSSRWRVAFGHHPYVSNGPHGNAGGYDGRAGVPGISGDYVKAFFEAHLCGKVDLYLSGHDHNLQWLEPVADCGATQFVVSGGGGAGTYPLPGAGRSFFQAQTLGFWWLEFRQEGWTAAAYDAEGTLLFEGEATGSPVGGVGAGRAAART